jgi:hypothetical protein
MHEVDTGGHLEQLAARCEAEPLPNEAMLILRGLGLA